MMIRDMRGDELFVCGEGLILMLDARGAGVTWKSCGDGVVVVGFSSLMVEEDEKFKFETLS